MATRWMRVCARKLPGARTQVDSGQSGAQASEFWWAPRFGFNCSKPSRIGKTSVHHWAEELEGAPVRRALTQPLGGRTSSSGKRLKERGFDDIVEKEKTLRFVLSIKDVVKAEPSRSMTLLELGKRKGEIGFKAGGRVIAFLKRYPGVFKVHETAEFGKLAWFQLTPEAEDAVDAELAIRRAMDDEVVTKVRKLLMMSTHGTLPLSKIAHLGRDLGLPDDFRTSVVHEHPIWFRVVGSNGGALDFEGPKLELVGWNTQKQERGLGHDSLSMSAIDIPKGPALSKFDEVDCPSPYQDGTMLHHRSVQFEKRAVLVVQELLSLTLEKRVLVDHLTHFRKEFNFSKKVYGMLIRHPEYFYVSRKGSRDTVFLRRAFEEIRVPGNRKEYGLIDKHPLVLVKERIAALMEVNPMDSYSKRVPAPFQERCVPEHDHIVPAQGHAATKIPW